MLGITPQMNEWMAQYWLHLQLGEDAQDFKNSFYLYSQSFSMQSGSEEKGLNHQVGLALMSNFRSNWLSDVPKRINTMPYEFWGRPHGSQCSTLSTTADMQLKAPLLSLAWSHFWEASLFQKRCQYCGYRRVWQMWALPSRGFCLSGMRWRCWNKQMED